MELTVTSTVFIICLLIGPLIISRNVTARRYSFLAVSGILFLLSFQNIISTVCALIFIILPYLYIFLQTHASSVNKEPTRSLIYIPIVIQVILFIYLNQYTWVFNLLNVEIPSFISILGLSYILFRQLDVLLQVNAKLVKQVDLIDYLNYLLSFWTLLAGPIQRYRDFIENFYHPAEVARSDELKYLHRCANGFIKIFVGVYLLTLKDDIAQYYLDTGNLLYLVPVLYLFPIYLYLNFSGYCDVVIAMARWSGFILPENFDKPYLARDMVEMWNRWHISLSQWLRDYLYQPLFKLLLTHTSSKHLSTCQYASIFVTFTLMGIWHGTTLSFLIFGLIQGVGLVISMFYRNLCKRHFGKEGYKRYYASKKVEYFERFMTLHFWCFSLIFVEYDVSTFIKNALIVGGNLGV